jgi:ketosteroid isomerase-like protein
MSPLSISQPAAVIRDLYDSFARGDVAAVLGLMAADIVWNEAENFIYSDRNPYRGPQAVLDGLFIRLATEWEGLSVNPESFVSEGDRVVVLGRYKGTYRATGKAVNAQFVHAWTLSGGKVAGFQQYTDTLQFARAAGA